MDKKEKPTVAELAKQLKKLSDWKTFATQLPGIEDHDIQTIEINNHLVQNQKLALFSTWLNKNPTASWKDVEDALNEAGMHVLASEISLSILGETDIAAKKTKIPNFPQVPSHSSGDEAEETNSPSTTTTAVPPPPPPPPSSAAAATTTATNIRGWLWWLWRIIWLYMWWIILLLVSIILAKLYSGF